MKNINPSSVALPFAHSGLTGLPLQSLRVFFMTNRKRLERIYGNFYKVPSGFDINVCVYCGSSASGFDHCPPLSVVEGLDIAHFKKHGGHLLRYPSCAQCNSMLSTYSDDNILYRIAYLTFKYERKIKNLTPWSKKELKTMGFRMRQYIVNKQCRYQILNNKLVRLYENMYNEEYLKYQ